MLDALARKFFGSKNERDLKRLDPLVQSINEFEPNMKSLSDEACRTKTQEFKDRIANGESVDDLAS